MKDIGFVPWRQTFLKPRLLLVKTQMVPVFRILSALPQSKGCDVAIKCYMFVEVLTHPLQKFRCMLRILFKGRRVVNSMWQYSGVYTVSDGVRTVANRTLTYGTVFTRTVSKDLSHLLKAKRGEENATTRLLSFVSVPAQNLEGHLEGYLGERRALRSGFGRNFWPRELWLR
ncbi:hypothetical protein BCR41DRAFT_390929 [Lobosporangium transversale]|uniref:Uncharacterized protein n=1 Tax=Lobosporangium transversale TaxID=64571 RepID=A0A1Y2G550_9FUNG|nr:hypothetical protein BCR41DRAFT_390929 [Lobosporangium transversale]ORY93714.1 hypothetical protein BCR41DRAFT_390929 [Lobosporangium transversale]|eukprot:XP_021875209.1 hypothetical protein BCR41DRAFT_390929 [Lobosporangium transversale]